MTVGQFAEKLGLPAAEIIKKVFMMGQSLTLNQLIEPDLCELIAGELGYEIILEVEDDRLMLGYEDARPGFKPGVTLEREEGVELLKILIKLYPLDALGGV